MHPALSVVLFTTLASAGLGALAWLGLDLALATGSVAPRRVSLVLAAGMALLTAGLVASTWHLGVRSRAWRAFSQWRSSWLSREAWLSLFVFVPAALLLLESLGLAPDLPTGPLGGALLVLACATLYATTKIYTTLKAIPAWTDVRVAPAFVVLGFAAGACWVLALAPPTANAMLPAALAATLWLAGAGLKLAYWRAIDRRALPSTRESATGLGGHGAVSVFEAPHTEANFLLREMGYVLARKHGSRLRSLCIAATASCAALCALAVAIPAATAPVAALALAPATIAVFVERWLFFAQARHLVTLYYGADPRAVADQPRSSSAPAP
jgi:sulfite dehydrogenase (quinone) subunit SoeC